MTATDYATFMRPSNSNWTSPGATAAFLGSAKKDFVPIKMRQGEVGKKQKHVTTSKCPGCSVQCSIVNLTQYVQLRSYFVLVPSFNRA